MEKQLSEEQLETLMGTLVNSAAADEGTVNKIAYSPKMWWGIQRQINEQKSAAVSPWPPVGKVLRWLMVGVPAVAAAALIISFLVFRPSEIPGHIATSVTQPVNTSVVPPPEIVQPISPVSIPTKAVLARSNREKHQVATPKLSGLAKRSPLKPEVPTVEFSKRSAEVKSEFIALSYARDPESGQIVRVKVPSSMMVSLGLVVSVEKPSDLVDAEVLVGDDGLTRAIRFIR